MKMRTLLQQTIRKCLWMSMLVMTLAMAVAACSPQVPSPPAPQPSAPPEATPAAPVETAAPLETSSSAREETPVADVFGEVPQGLATLDAVTSDIAARWAKLDSLRAAFVAYSLYTAPGSTEQTMREIRGSGEMLKRDNAFWYAATLTVSESAGANRLAVSLGFDGFSAFEELMQPAETPDQTSKPVFHSGKPDSGVFEYLPGLLPVDTPLAKVLGGDYTLTLEQDAALLDRPVYVIKAQKTSADPAAALGDTIHYFIDKKTAVPLRVEWRRSDEQPVAQFELTQFEANAPVDPGRFRGAPMAESTPPESTAAPAVTTTFPPEVSAQIQIEPPAKTEG